MQKYDISINYYYMLISLQISVIMAIFFLK